MNIRLPVEEVEIAGSSRRLMVEVSLSGVTWENLIESIDLDVFVTEAGVSELLDIIGVAAVKEYFDLKAADE